MSFLSVLKTIGRDFVIGTNAVAPYAPYIEAIPSVGPVFGTIFGAVTTIEQLISQPKSGSAKKTAVSAIVTAAHPEVSPQDLSVWIDRLVAGLNQVHAVIGLVNSSHPA